MASLIEYNGGFLIADAVDDAAAEDNATMTDHPVESGSVVSDHVIHDPTTLALTLFATQTPIYPDDNFRRQQRTVQGKIIERGRQSVELPKYQRRRRNVQVNAATGLASLFDRTQPTSFEGARIGPAKDVSYSVTVLAADAPIDRVNAFYAELLRLKSTSTLCTVNFKGFPHHGMVLLSVRKIDAQLQLGASTFACRFRKFTTVATEQTTLPAVPAARKKQSRGAKGLENEETDPARKESLLSRVVSSFTDD